jgi:hypothetical protein
VGLAATGGPEEGQELAHLHCEVDTVDGGDRAETLGDVHQVDRADLCHLSSGDVNQS